jgi:hypothetical protein
MGVDSRSDNGKTWLGLDELLRLVDVENWEIAYDVTDGMDSP